MSEYRGYNIELDGTFGLRSIKSIGSGALPKVLRGSYTKQDFAERDIDLYLDSKESSNGEKVSTNRG